MKEYLKLDFLTLEDISIEAGMPIEEEAYIKSLKEAKANKCLFEVRQNEMLLAYATLRYYGDGSWFVLMFVTHPNRRSKDTFIELFRKIITHLDNVNAKCLISNVFKVNKLAVNFHKKLGFKVTREGSRGYEFTLDLSSPEETRIKQLLRSSVRHYQKWQA